MSPYQALFLAATLDAGLDRLAKRRSPISQLDVCPSGSRSWVRRRASAFPFTSSHTRKRTPTSASFWVGLTNTPWFRFLGIMGATALGFMIGVARLSPNWAVATAALVYVETVRNLPLLLHVLIWYNVAIRSLPPYGRRRICSAPCS